MAGSPSRLRGIGHLRGHETDRLAALAREINGLGGSVRETDDGLEITPRPLHAGVFETYDDHRMAFCAALVSLRCPVVLRGSAAVAKSFPNFWSEWGLSDRLRFRS